jgi:hypothetical protein
MAAGVIVGALIALNAHDDESVYLSESGFPEVYQRLSFGMPDLPPYWEGDLRTDFWHLRRVVARKFFPRELLFNVVIGALLTAGVGWTTERWRRRGRLSPRFSLSSLFAASASVTTYFVLRQENELDVRSGGTIFEAFTRDPLALGAFIVVLTAIPLTWLAFFDLLGLALNGLASAAARRTDA